MSLLERLSRGDRFAWDIGCRLVEIREGYARAELKVEERHLNAAGMCQGGVMFTLADLTFAAVCNSRGIMTVGVSNNISYMYSFLVSGKGILVFRTSDTEKTDAIIKAKGLHEFA